MPVPMRLFRQLDTWQHTTEKRISFYRIHWQRWCEKMDFYRVIWSKIGGRPWTYLLRYTWHRLEGLWIAGLVAIGALLGRWFWNFIFWFLLVFALGYIAGHLFWGNEYIPDQKDE